MAIEVHEKMAFCQKSSYCLPESLWRQGIFSLYLSRKPSMANGEGSIVLVEDDFSEVPVLLTKPGRRKRPENGVLSDAAGQNSGL